jgi:hypothetical protein
MNFVVPVTSVTVSIIGGGLNISASLEVFDEDGGFLGTVQHIYRLYGDRITVRLHRSRRKEHRLSNL